jgi:hypothetical protein
MRSTLFTALLFWCSIAPAAVLNVEFNFTPFTGDIKNQTVQRVPGKAVVFVNNVLLADDVFTRAELPVIFDEREVAAAIWVPTASLGPALRKGKNRIRIEFEPADMKLKYVTQFRSTQVVDQVSKGKTASGAASQTNQSGQVIENKPATGKVVLEREFVADFATDLAWHHYPAVTALTDEDKKRIGVVLKARTDVFKPDFAAAYKLLSENKNVQLAEVRKLKCLDAAYAAGVRIAPAAAEQIEYVMTGNPEVMLKSKKGDLYPVADQKSFDRIKGEQAQMCAGMVISMLFPPRLVVVRAPSGEWQVVY